MADKATITEQVEQKVRASVSGIELKDEVCTNKSYCEAKDHQAKINPRPKRSTMEVPPSTHQHREC